MVCKVSVVPIYLILQKSELTKQVTKNEVYEALMSMKSYKAPGADGFQPIFFKMFWDDVGNDIWSFVKKAFETGTFDMATSDTLLVLIPKSDHPTSFKEFRPISLCNVTYKIISKVLVNRLRAFLNDIISPLQSSFIPGRSTKDNAIIFQEIIYHMQKKKKRKVIWSSSLIWRRLMTELIGVSLNKP